MMRRSGQLLGWVFWVKNQRSTFSFDLCIGRSERILVVLCGSVMMNLMNRLQFCFFAFVPGKLGVGQWVGYTDALGCDMNQFHLRTLFGPHE